MRYVLGIVMLLVACGCAGRHERSSYSESSNWSLSAGDSLGNSFSSRSSDTAYTDAR